MNNFRVRAHNTLCIVVVIESAANSAWATTSANVIRELEEIIYVFSPIKLLISSRLRLDHQGSAVLNVGRPSQDWTPTLGPPPL